jgi:broad specificity phosphatase PhoE
VNRRAFATTCVILCTLACSRGPSNTPEANSTTKTLYIVRHAEKQIIEGESDPELTDAGHARAAALTQALEGISIDAVYSSNYRRTQQTVAPYAELQGIPVIPYEPGDASGFAATLRSARARQVLIAGHSNTIPALIAELGGEAPIIEDGQYGDLFVLTLGDEGTRLETRHFGP